MDWPNFDQQLQIEAKFRLTASEPETFHQFNDLTFGSNPHPAKHLIVLSIALHNARIYLVQE